MRQYVVEVIGDDNEIYYSTNFAYRDLKQESSVASEAIKNAVTVREAFKITAPLERINFR